MINTHHVILNDGKLIDFSYSHNIYLVISWCDKILCDPYEHLLPLHVFA